METQDELDNTGYLGDTKDQARELITQVKETF